MEGMKDMEGRKPGPSSILGMQQHVVTFDNISNHLTQITITNREAASHYQILLNITTNNI